LMRKRMTLRRILAPKPAPQIVQKPKPKATPAPIRLRGTATPYEALAAMQTGPMGPGGVRLLFSTDNDTASETLDSVRDTLFAWQPHPSHAFDRHSDYWVPTLFENVAYGDSFVVRYITVDREGQRQLEANQMVRSDRGIRMRFHVVQRFSVRRLLDPLEGTEAETVTVFELAPHHIVFVENRTGFRGNFSGIY